MRRRTKRKTDFVIIVLHWILVVAVALAIATGLRIFDPAGKALGGLAQWLLPTNNLWPLHIWAGIALITFAAAYPLYLLWTGLDGRVRLDRARLASLRTGGAAGRGTLTVVVIWLFFALLAIEAVTGVVLYLGYGGTIVDLHRDAMWGLIALTAAHVVSHLAFGGSTQLTRVFRPAFDAGSPDSALASSYVEADGTLVRYFRRRAGIIVGVAVAASLVGWSVQVADRAWCDVLPVMRIARSVAPALSDGLADPIWQSATPIKVHTQQGVNFGGSGATVIEIRALHDEDTAYFAFSWNDPTRSLKHLPLIKAADGWHVLHRESDLGALKVPIASVGAHGEERDEGAFSEDKFAVMVAASAKGFGPGAFHVGERPLGDRPPSSSGRGLHYRTDGGHMELWLWHAVGGLPSSCEHLHVGVPTKPTPDEVLGLTPYRGGIRADGRRKLFVDNVQTAGMSEDEVTVPLRLPRSLAAARSALAFDDMRADHSDPENTRWSMTEIDSIPYTSALDATVPVGTLIPGAITTPSPSGEVAGDLSCAAHWEVGRWILVVSRHLKATRPDDITLADGTVLWVAAFDHDPSQHTRHMRPISLALR